MSQHEFTHAHMVGGLKKAGMDILDSLNEYKCDAIHMAMGVCTEAGELLDAIKKWTMYNKPLDRENVIEELGDLEFYMEGLRQNLGITREETLEHNMHKLGIRYKGHSYSDEQAIARKDKQDEA